MKNLLSIDKMFRKLKDFLFNSNRQSELSKANKMCDNIIITLNDIENILDI